jgi:uncharacterized protein YggE
MTTTIRISLAAHSKATALAQAAGVSLQQILESALESYRRQELLAAANAAYAAVAAQPDRQAELVAELSEWDATLADGLKGEA